MQRKAIIYTGIIAITLLLLVLIIYKPRYQSNISESYEISMINDFAKMIDTDIPRSARIASIRALLAIEDYASMNAEFVNLSSVFKEALMNGTVNTTEMPIVINDSLGAYIERVRSKGKMMGIFIDIDVKNITLSQHEPYSIDLSLSLKVNISSIDNSTRIDYSKEEHINIPISGLRDPLISVYTEGRFHNAINFSEDPSVQDGNVSKFRTFVENMYYYPNPSAPSILQRFEGNLSPSPYGIECMLNLEELSAQDIEIYNNRTIVDYLYFSNISADYCDLDSLPSWIKVDSDHFYYYNLDNTTYSSCG